LSFLESISGKRILSGQHNFPNCRSQYSDRAAGLVGKYPLIWGSDFGFAAAGSDSVSGRDLMIEEAKKQHAAGSVITLMWHAVAPTQEEPGEWRRSVLCKLKNSQWLQLLDSTSDVHQRWLRQIDNIAMHLRELQRANVPVLWRPYHESNGSWFWWGGRKGAGGSAALYRMLYDRFVHYHHIDNLLWVWNANARSNPLIGHYRDYYPGPQYCDILAVDVYGAFRRRYHDRLAALANGKPIALGEVGQVPAPPVLINQPAWAWFMIWADRLDRNNLEDLRAIFHSPGTLSRGDPHPEAATSW
jgi:mannan endo-1,4-beta-mannosidase